MKKVFDLAIELETDPERVALTQALTLNTAKPQMGLAGTFGLFGSAEWWESIRDGRMPLQIVGGAITRVYRAGQDSSGPSNTVDVHAEDGSSQSVGIYLNDPHDLRLFRVGHSVGIAYALDELKPQAARNGDTYSRIALEMAVTLVPAG